MELKSSGEPTLLESTLIDCLLPALLTGIVSVPELANNLVLKGGAALRQFYFPDARYSNDLDFSALSQSSWPGALTGLVEQAALQAGNLLGVGRDVRLYVQEFERPFKPVPMRSFQFVYEWNHSIDVRVGLEISLDETIVRVPSRLPLARYPQQESAAGYPAICMVYALEELVAEKLRALLQWTKQLKEKGRHDMPVARTYFDLHYVLDRFGERVFAAGFAELLRAKCLVRGVAFEGAGSFFDEQLQDLTRQLWHEQLSGVLAEPPDPVKLLAKLKVLVAKLVE